VRTRANGAILILLVWRRGPRLREVLILSLAVKLEASQREEASAVEQAEFGISEVAASVEGLAAKASTV
jgi:hypothetical protein